MRGTRWGTRNKLRTIVVAILVASAVMSSSASTRAAAMTDVMSQSTGPGTNAATDWNAIAMEFLTAPGVPRPGQIVFLDLAVVQVAVHDAVQAIDQRFEPYHVHIPGATGSPEAAAAKAAHDLLVNILPLQTTALDTRYLDYLGAHGLAVDDPGVSVGAQAAAGIIALRANDGRIPNPLPPPFTGGTEPGVWRPTAPGFAPMALPWIATVTPFTLNSGDQFRADPPPLLSSARYAKDYDEVKALGALVGSERTPEQTQLATFFTTNLFVLYIRTLRDIAVADTDNIGDSARLLALGTMAIANSVITSWDSKSHYVLWRPITAIQEGDNDGNRRTAGDRDWQPLTVTPNYPDYTSGANSVAGALTRTLALFFGKDGMTFTVFSQNLAAVPNMRTYHRFSELASDIVDVRIYQGIHFRFADEAGRTQGRRVARWAFRHYLQPIDNDD